MLSHWWIRREPRREPQKPYAESPETDPQGSSVMSLERRAHRHREQVGPPGPGAVEKPLDREWSRGRSGKDRNGMLSCDFPWWSRDGVCVSKLQLCT